MTSTQPSSVDVVDITITTDGTDGVLYLSDAIFSGKINLFKSKQFIDVNVLRVSRRCRVNPYNAEICPEDHGDKRFLFSF